ncbi:uncharacterized protein [Henckelia pumila]|uniref:uncharacterized protein n=1 Tax=Henckelia pumila TaxID=405737 RepID=UPI003C6E3A01
MSNQECLSGLFILSGDSSEEEFPYDLEIERTLYRRRRESRRRQEKDERVVEDLRGAMAENANLSEDPHKHLMEFHVVCTSMKPHGVIDEQIQLRAFPFCLNNAAKDWLYYLPSRSITTWTKMKRIFVEKYFPASRAANIRKEIYGIKKFAGESHHENWERGGVFVDKTPVQARNLKENMAINSQQFGTNRNDHAPSKNNEVNVSSLEQKLIELTNFVRQMAVGNGKTVIECGVCAKVGHATNMCPTLQEGSAEQVNAAGGFPGPPQRNYDPQINLGLKHHRTIKLIGHLILHSHSVLKFQRLETQASIQHLNTQVGQLETTINRLEAQNSSSLPSQTVVNPKENVSAITLRSGREFKVHE